MDFDDAMEYFQGCIVQHRHRNPIGSIEETEVKVNILLSGSIEKAKHQRVPDQH